VLCAAGFDVTLATYKGMTPLPGKMSMDPDFIDPQQGVAMNPKAVIDRVYEILDTGEWDNPLKFSEVNMADYDALVMVGGAGSPLDIVGNITVHNIIYDAYKSGKIIGALCYTVGALAFTRDPENDYKSVIYGKKVTAHPHEWDFVGDHKFEFVRRTPENPGMELTINGFLFPLQYMVEDAVGDRSLVFADPKTNRDNPCVIYDHPFVTGLSVESSTLYGQKLVEVINSN
jgi:putative intracellular protease/amidase